MSRSFARFAVLTAIATVLSLTAALAPASAGTVPNRFHRTCTWSCSPFVQVNGPYVPGIISNCVTYNWWGGVSSSYLKWSRC